VTSIILAGGKSSRFGPNKALQTIAGKTLVQYVVDRLATLTPEIIIVTAQGGEGTYHCKPFASCHSEQSEESPAAQDRPREAIPLIKIVADIYPDKGPLCGIYSGLIASSNSRAIVVGCDMPFPSIALLDYMTQISPGFDVVAPRIGKRVERLCAVYSKNCLAPIQGLLERNELRISELLSMVRVKYVEEDEINRFDPDHLSFFNINTQADLDKARGIAASLATTSPEIISA
jgi:molybdopterin-guanine dinucleotide biosynthesis protein A